MTDLSKQRVRQANLCECSGSDLETYRSTDRRKAPWSVTLHAAGTDPELGVRLPEIRRFLKGRLTAELATMMRKAGAGLFADNPGSAR